MFLRLAKPALLALSLMIFAQGAAVAASADREIVTGQTVVTNNETKEETKVSVSIENFDSVEAVQKQIAKTIAKVSSKAGPSNTSVVISTDEADLLKKLAADTTIGPEVLVAPFDLRNQAPEKAAVGWSQFTGIIKNYPSKLVQAAKDDRIGLMIVTFNTLNETYVWLHADQLSTFERSANIAFTVATSIAFGIDKQAWARVARPFKTFFRNVLGSSEALGRNHAKELAVGYLANLTLATSINMARLSFVSIDRLMDGGMQLSSLTYPLLMGIVATAASFSWSEHIALVNDNHQKTKFIFRRTQEIRSVLLGVFATTAYLLHPEIYGWSSWAVLIGTGVAGMTVYLNHDKINRYIERSPFLDRWAQKLKIKDGPTLCPALFN
jgi:hypothetical protein